MASIHIQNVPQPLRRRLCVKAKAAGLSLSDYLLREIAAMAPKQMSVAAFRKRLRSREPIELGVSAAEILREGRGE